MRVFVELSSLRSTKWYNDIISKTALKIVLKRGVSPEAQTRTNEADITALFNSL